MDPNQKRNSFLEKKYLPQWEEIPSICIGDPSMTIPPLGIDTTVSRDFREILKYEDNEFYPTHGLMYTLKNKIEKKPSIRLAEFQFEAMPFSREQYEARNLPFDFDTMRGCFSNISNFNVASDEEEDYYTGAEEEFSSQSRWDDISDSDSEGDSRAQAEYTSGIQAFTEELFTFSMVDVLNFVKSIWFTLFSWQKMQDSEDVDSDSSISD